MKCFTCGSDIQTYLKTPLDKDEIVKNLREDMKYFYYKMFINFINAGEPDVCVNCQNVIKQSADFKKMALKNKKYVKTKWFEDDQNKIDLKKIFDDSNTYDLLLKHVKNESSSETEQEEDFQSFDKNDDNDLDGSTDTLDVMNMQAIFCSNDPGTIRRVEFYKKQEELEDMKKQRTSAVRNHRENVAHKENGRMKLSRVRSNSMYSTSREKGENVTNDPTGLIRSRRKSVYYFPNKQRRYNTCSLCNKTPLDAATMK